MRYNIQCQHEAQNLSTDQTCPDYHPLTRDQVKELVTLLFQRDRIQLDPGQPLYQALSQIQVRLGQGIPGLVCPYELLEAEFGK